MEYAVYVFGRYQYRQRITPQGEVHKRVQPVPKADWRVHLPDHHEGYITPEDFERNQARLARNRTNGEGTVLSGAAREGLALLQGMLICGRCGRALTVRYQGNGGLYPQYLCSARRRDGLATTDCMSMRSDLLDNAIGEAVLTTLQPAELKLAVTALNELEQRDRAIMRQWDMRIERAGYEVALAERRYQECDPANRLVAGTLECRWNDAMLRLEAIRTEAAQFKSQKARVATSEQKAQVLALARNLPRLWRASTTSAKDRKRMLRLLIRDITVEKLSTTRQAVLHIRWQGSACTDITVDLPKPAADAMRYPTAFVERVRVLSQHLPDRQIVAHLNQEGLRSASGKSFTLEMVKWIRYRYEIEATCFRRPDELTVQQLARQLGISAHVVYYWIERHVVQARKLDGRGPWWITLDPIKEQQLRDWVRTSGHLKPQHSITQL
ncbi:recombinase zinc beta ribbon domain-containing protein [Paraburkholderia sediminicola]|uniref:recombinase zinc beta ribbon domain-containing protein n=1 Tax=Paraburkholderia sediminicola TaxID=458836 RepID=UPI0038B8AFB7